jgi:hypothetical protein
MDYPSDDSYGNRDASYASNPYTTFDSSLPPASENFGMLYQVLGSGSSSAQSGDMADQTRPSCEDCHLWAPFLCGPCVAKLMEFDTPSRWLCDAPSEENAISSAWPISSASPDPQTYQDYGEPTDSVQTYLAALGDDFQETHSGLLSFTPDDAMALEQWLPPLAEPNVHHFELGGHLPQSDAEYAPQPGSVDETHHRPEPVDDVPAFQEVVLDLNLNHVPGPANRRRRFNAIEWEEIAAKRVRVCDDCKRRKRKVSSW